MITVPNGIFTYLYWSTTSTLSFIVLIEQWTDLFQFSFSLELNMVSRKRLGRNSNPSWQRWRSLRYLFYVLLYKWRSLLGTNQRESITKNNRLFMIPIIGSQRKTGGRRPRSIWCKYITYSLSFYASTISDHHLHHLHHRSRVSKSLTIEFGVLSSHCWYGGIWSSGMGQRTSDHYHYFHLRRWYVIVIILHYLSFPSHDFDFDFDFDINNLYWLSLY